MIAPIIWMAVRRTAILAVIFVTIASPTWSLELGETAPEFKLSSNLDTTVDLRDYHGQVIYLDFWASWCPPCRESLPWMSELQKKFGPKGLRVIGVNLDSERESAQKLLSETGTEIAVLFDPEGKTPEQYKVEAMPSSFIIDRQGKIRSVHQGFVAEDRKQIETELEALLSAGSM